MLPFVLPKSAALLSVTSRSILNIFGSCCSVVEIFHHLGFCAVSADSSLPAFYALTLHKIFEVNPLNPVVVLVPSSLSRQQSGLGTSTNTIFINFLKKKYWEYWLQVCTIRPVHVSSFSGDDLILSNAYTCVVASVIKLLRHS